jgi:hypothetical protein
MSDEQAAPGDPEGMSGAPTEEELRAALEEQMKHIRVDDVILQTVATLVNLAGRRLGMANDDPVERDVGQAKQAIDAVRALLPYSPEEQLEPIKAALTQLQMVFAQEAQAPAPGATGGSEPPAGDEPGSPSSAADEAEREKARSKIWTPPGA